jgi:outer membrane lipoprotein-sorting protein
VRHRTLPWALAGAALALALSWTPGRAEEPDATELMKAAHLNQYYAGDDGISHVLMTITSKRGSTREREFIMLRKDLEEGGVQKYYAYFLKPDDVRRTSFMAWKNPDKDDSRWIYVPALDLVKPISANDKKSSFVGSDFSYEDVSGRHWTEDNHKLLREEALDGVDCYVIESVPKSDDYFARKLTWIDKQRMLPLREEFYRKMEDEKPERTFESLEIRDVDGFPTEVKRRMTNNEKGNSTVVEFTKIEYNIGIPEDLFTERYLKSPPREYIQP